ncbi:heparan-alpha-glucosaminide N-acetyltransferase [Oceaniglobus roseus]|uniref:heparan-alpha-glucosaminide N-acetyltransferase n=1 Tax=Oceaniglobus roseus TaxID=1737570 RepID=UPI000C7EFFA6|nr:heparan-alpha-glucosaminide N-acetyltransferase [Kandeliimicrobium roseum]
MTDAKAPPLRRVAAIDIARTLALVAMAVYHLIYDLMMFGVVSSDVALSGGFRWLAVLTAGSFLFLAGIGLKLANRERLHLGRALKRIGVIAVAAALVSLATYVAMPGAFVFFGILHSIATASLIGLLFVRLPWWVSLAGAAAVVWVAFNVASPLFDPKWLGWTGLGTVRYNTVDFEPVFPWLAPLLVGLAITQLTIRSAFWTPRPISGLTAALGWPGRHSLVIYLIHQPVLVALVWSAVQLGLIG